MSVNKIHLLWEGFSYKPGKKMARQKKIGAPEKLVISLRMRSHLKRLPLSPLKLMLDL